MMVLDNNSAIAFATMPHVEDPNQLETASFLAVLAGARTVMRIRTIPKIKTNAYAQAEISQQAESLSTLTRLLVLL
jgi:hypothetical protein